MTVTTILFDLGGVLVDFTGTEDVRQWMQDDPGAEGAKSLWGTSAAIQDFEHGRIDEDAFAEAFVAEWRLTIPPDRFKWEFRSWVTGPRPGAFGLLERLRARYQVACFSNTNAAHWHGMVVASGLIERLDKAYASFELGMMKPSEAAFAHVAGDLGREPHEILFFDDGAGNVEGARVAGLEADQVKSLAEIERVLAARGLI